MQMQPMSQSQDTLCGEPAPPLRGLRRRWPDLRVFRGREARLRPRELFATIAI